jgi:hypothetical protein
MCPTCSFTPLSVGFYTKSAVTQNSVSVSVAKTTDLEVFFWGSNTTTRCLFSLVWCSNPPVGGISSKKEKGMYSAYNLYHFLVVCLSTLTVML